MQPEKSVGPLITSRKRAIQYFFLGAATIMTSFFFSFYISPAHLPKKIKEYQHTVQTPVGPMEHLTAEHIQLCMYKRTQMQSVRYVKDIPGKSPIGTKGCFCVAWTTFLLSKLIQNRPLASIGFPPQCSDLSHVPKHRMCVCMCVRVCVFHKTAEVTGY